MSIPGEHRDDIALSNLAASLLSFRLVRTSTFVARVTSRIHRMEFGLSESEFNVVLALSKAAVPQTSSMVAETTAMDKAKVSRAVSSLNARDWLLRSRATSDRRFEYLTLTELGGSSAARLLPKVEKAEQAILECLTENERREVRCGLAVLDRALAANAH